VKKEAFSNSLLFGLGKLKIGGPHVLIFCGVGAGATPLHLARRRSRGASVHLRRAYRAAAPISSLCRRPFFVPLPPPISSSLCRRAERKGERKSKVSRVEVEGKESQKLPTRVALGSPGTSSASTGKDSRVHRCRSMLPVLYWLSPCLLFF